VAGAYGAGGSALAAAESMIAEAIKASGAIVRVAPDDFMAILSRVEQPLLVAATGGLFSKKYEYLTGYKGLVFYTKTKTPLEVADDVELVVADRIWIPS